MNEHKKQTFQTEMGQKVNVDRQFGTSEDAKEASKRLHDVGTMLNPIPDVLEYKGTAAIHIYQSPQLGQIFYVSQVGSLKVTELEASNALTELKGSLMEAYGRDRKTKRSGF